MKEHGDVIDQGVKALGRYVSDHSSQLDKHTHDELIQTQRELTEVLNRLGDVSPVHALDMVIKARNGVEGLLSRLAV